MELTAGSTLSTPITHVAACSATKMRERLAERGRKKTASRGGIQIPKIKIKDVRGGAIDASMLDFSRDFVVNDGILVLTDDINSQFQCIVLAQFVWF